MRKRKKKIYSLGIVFFLIGSAVGCSGRPSEETARATRQIFAMDTIMDLTAYGEKGEEAVTEAVRLIQKLERLFSVTDAGSDIRKINQANGKPVAVAKETYEIIRQGMEISRETDGAFDISIYPLVKAWGFTEEKKTVPSGQKREEAKNKVDYREIRCLSDNKIQIKPDMEIDLGGIAKGYVSQKIMALWKRMGVSSGIVSLGGNVQTIGKKEDGSMFQIGIVDPSDTEQLFGTLPAENKAVVTSGIYQRNFTENGVLYHHILDAKTGAPAENTLSSVTVIGGDGTRADALATALFVMGEKEAKKYQKNHPEIQIVLIRKDGTFWQSEQTAFSK